jgi:MFS family permease
MPPVPERAEREPQAVAPTLGPVLWALIASQLGLHSAMAGLRMAAPLLALREGWSALAVGVLMALFAVAPVLLALRAGRMADRHGYHRPVMLAVGLNLAGVLVALLATWVDAASSSRRCAWLRRWPAPAPTSA